MTKATGWNYYFGTAGYECGLPRSVCWLLQTLSCSSITNSQWLTLTDFPVIPMVQHQSRKSHKVTLMVGVLVVTLNFLLPLEDLKVHGRPLHVVWCWLQGEAMQSTCSRFSSPIQFVLVFVIQGACQPQSYVLRISQ